MADGVKKINENIIKDGRTINITTSIDPIKLEGGTLFVSPSLGDLKYVNISVAGIKSWSKFDPANIFHNSSIVTKLLADSSVIGIKIANDAISTPKLINLSVTTPKLANLGVTTEKIADLGITSPKIARDAVTSVHIYNSSVQTSKLADAAVTSDKIARETILDSNIAIGTITGSKISNLTITHSNMADNSIITSKITDSSVTTSKIDTSAITVSKLALDSVSTEKIINGAVTSLKIKDKSIATNHIDKINGSVLEGKSVQNIAIADLAIDTRTLANLSVTKDKLDANLKDQIDKSVKLEKTQTITGSTYSNYAWVKGSLMVKPEGSGTSKIELTGDFTATGSVTASKCYNPVFADLAEGYIPTEKLEPGDAVCLSLEGGLKVEKLNIDNSNRFLGFVSNDYATVMGASKEELETGKKVAIVLIGRIDIKAEGTAKIGDFLYISNGRPIFAKGRGATACGRVLENKVLEDKQVLCQLWA